MLLFDHINVIHHIKILNLDPDVVVSPKQFQKKIFSTKYKKILSTDSTISGSSAVASQRFIKINIFGFDSRFATLYRKFFS
jgi:hypothetical protein